MLSLHSTDKEGTKFSQLSPGKLLFPNVLLLLKIQDNELYGKKAAAVFLPFRPPMARGTDISVRPALKNGNALVFRGGDLSADL
jgi:hypothetical protein